MLTYPKIALILASLLTAAALAAQPIYKVKDRHGNIIYTDEKPSEDAEPIDLPELGVMGEDSSALGDILGEAPAIDPEIEPLHLGIAQPVDGLQLTDTGEGVALELYSNVDLPPSTQIIVFINDQPQKPMRQLAISLVGLDSGTYRLRAELQTPSGRVLTRTEEVTFVLQKAPEILAAP